MCGIQQSTSAYARAAGADSSVGAAGASVQQGSDAFAGSSSTPLGERRGGRSERGALLDQLSPLDLLRAYGDRAVAIGPDGSLNVRHGWLSVSNEAAALRRPGNRDAFMASIPGAGASIPMRDRIPFDERRNLDPSTALERAAQRRG